MIRVHLAGKGVSLSYTGPTELSETQAAAVASRSFEELLYGREYPGATDFRILDSGRLVVERSVGEGRRVEVVAAFNAGAWIFVERCGGEQLADSAADSEADEPGV